MAAEVVATDNCTVKSINVSHVDVGSACGTNRTFCISATDECGNTSATNTVVYSWAIDTNAPVLVSVPSGTNFGCNPSPALLPTDASVASEVVATDNCTVKSINVSHVDVGSACGTNRTFCISATDECGNTSATNTVVYSWAIDTNAPVLVSVPSGTNFGCNPSPALLPTDASVAAEVVASDNCTVKSINVSHVDVGSACGTNRTFCISATDECGNTSPTNTVVYSWTIDTNAPVLVSVPSGTNFGCNPSPALLPTDASVAAKVVASDNCTVKSINVSHVDVGSACGTNRTFCISATDECGNTSPTNTVVYSWTIDTNAPVLVSVPSGTNFGCNPSPALLPTDASVAAKVVASDNCTVKSINVSHVDVGSACGTNRTFCISATDECGNTSATNTVVYSWAIDTNAPVLVSVPSGTNFGCNPSPALLPTDASVAAEVVASDNCTVKSINVSHVDVGSACGTNRTFCISATDECGNTSATNTVVYSWAIDTNAPVLVSVPSGTNFGCNPSSALLPTDASVAAEVVASDNCTVKSMRLRVATDTA